jgi:hypothetical protein
MARPIDEEAHFRIDEMERKFASIPPMESIQAAFTGMLAMALEEMKRVVEKGQPKDQDLSEVTARLDKLCALMCEPKSRTVTANLPSGPVSMTIDEIRH